MTKRVFTVIAFEFFAFVKNKAYIVLTAVLALVAFAAFFIPGLLGGGKETPAQPTDPASVPLLYVAGNADTETLAALLPGFEVQTSDVLSDIALSEAFTKHERLYGILDLSGDAVILRINRLGFADSAPALIEDAVKQYRAVSALQEAGLPRTDALSRLGPFPFQVEELAAAIGKSEAQTYMYTYIILMWLYMAVLIYGQVVAGSVAAEKGNRTMELLITSTKPINLLVGKVLGTGLAGLLQVFLILTPALISYRLNRGQLSGLLGVAEITPAMIGYTMLFFLVGYFTFAFLFSALGSLVSRSEDVNKTVMVISMPLIAVFMVAMSALFMPTAGHVTVLSFVPFFSPFLMFVRTQMLAVPFWQVALSIAISLATIALVAFVSAKIYRLGTLFYGNSVKLKSLRRMLKY